MQKTCTRCGIDKPATREFFGSTPSGGLKGFCRACMNAASRRYEASNKSARKRRDERRAETTGGVRLAGFSIEIKRALFDKQAGRCPCCFESLVSPERSEVDHILPLSRGGRDEPGNRVLTHAQCNREKKDKTLAEHWIWRVKVGLDSENLGSTHGLIP